MKNFTYKQYINTPIVGLFRLFNVAIVSLALFGSENVAAAPPSFHPEIIQLLQLSESNPDQAIMRIEDLLRQLPSDASDSDRRTLMSMQLQLIVDKEDKPKAKELIAQLTQFGNQRHDPASNILAANYQAKLLGLDKKFGEGLAMIEATFDAAKEVHDSLLTNQIESTAAELYFAIGNFKAALERHLGALNALNSSQTLKEGDWQVDLIRARTFNNIGNTYLALKNDAMAVNYLGKARWVAGHLDSPPVLSKMINDLAYAYATQKSPLAIETYQEVLALARKLGNHSMEAKSLGNLAGVSLDEKKYAECASFAEQGLHIAQQNGLSILEALAHSNLGICRIYMGEMQKGLAEHKLGIEIAKNNNDKPMLVDILSDLAIAYKNVGQFKDGLRTLEERDVIKKEVFKTDRARAIAEMKVRFDLGERQKEVEKLEQQNTLQQIEIQNKNLQRIVSVFIILSSILAAVGLLLLYRKVRNRNQHLHDANTKLHDQSTKDPLTGLLNRRAFENLIASFNAEGDRRATAATGLHDVIILLDIDHFKHVNDKYGHPTGDSVLVGMGKRLQEHLRAEDKLMRWGGEEFLIFLHKIHPNDVADIIQRTILTVEATPFHQADKAEADVPVTISAGYIITPLPGALDIPLSWEQALKLVDLELYMSKTGGRNRATGLDKITGSKAQIEALFAGDLQGAIDSGIVSLNCIKGTSLDKKVPTTSAEEVKTNNEVCL